MSSLNIMDFLEPVLLDFGAQLLDALKRSLEAAGKGGGPLEQSLEVLIDGQTMQVLAADYLIYVIQGRQAGGKMPPIEPILDWVRRKGFPVQLKMKRDGGLQTMDEAETSIAWAIAKTIQRDGEPGIDLLTVWEPILQDMVVKIGDASAKWVKASMTQSLTEAFANVSGVQIITN